MLECFEPSTGTEISVMRYSHGNTDFHTHNFLELAYILEGTALHTINGETVSVNPGDYFIVDYSGSHRYQTLYGKQITLFNILFTPRFIDPVLSGCYSFQQILEHYLIRFQNAPVSFRQETVFHDDDGTILKKITEMEREYSYMRPGYAELLRCELIEIIILILRKFTNGNNKLPVHPCVCYVLDRINSDYMQPLTLTEISKNLHYSIPYISRLFKKETGISFAEYLQKKRIENACRLLLTTNKKVNEIAGLVGYSDLKNFQSVFKKIVNTTPKAYRMKSIKK